MSEPFLAEVRMVGFNFAPRGWAFCDGQILPISQNQALYSLLGTTYGGDGRTSFALPDLRGRTPIHVGSSNGTSHLLGQKGGAETHTLGMTEMPRHDHVLQASSQNGDSPIAAGNILAASPAADIYAQNAQAANIVTMNAADVTNAGGGQAHDNMQPFLTVSFCIALQGLYPSRN